MVKKESLMEKNVKRLKSNEKKFDHFGDYLVTFATLFALFTNFCKDYILDESKKTNYMVIILITLESMYIVAISIKIASHYSIKEYVKEYEIEKLNQKKAEKVFSPITVTSKNTEESNKELNRRINMSLAMQKLKIYFKKLFWVALAVALLGLGLYLIFIKIISDPMTTIAFIVVIMSIIFPIFAILALKELCGCFLLLFVEPSKD